MLSQNDYCTLSLRKITSYRYGLNVILPTCGETHLTSHINTTVNCNAHILKLSRTCASHEQKQKIVADITGPQLSEPALCLFGLVVQCISVGRPVPFIVQVYPQVFLSTDCLHLINYMPLYHTV